ncbi:unnamed protein product [Ilex paraguariensis]|uniref:LOB domain-containing protein n=1 Tax=Ilex paraguariensis TaxID=185542 RepID=A0ABC8R4N1_9AQUA
MDTRSKINKMLCKAGAGELPYTNQSLVDLFLVPVAYTKTCWQIACIGCIHNPTEEQTIGSYPSKDDSIRWILTPNGLFSSARVLNHLRIHTLSVPWHHLVWRLPVHVKEAKSNSEEGKMGDISTAMIHIILEEAKIPERAPTRKKVRSAVILYPLSYSFGFRVFLYVDFVDKMASSSSYNPPCAACKFLRRKCMPGCIFAPYFPPEEPQKFVNVHKIFGASNVTKLLNELLPHQREDAVNSLAYEAEARVRDPVYGCVGAITFLQRQVERLEKELDEANADLIRYAYNEIPTALPAQPGVSSVHPIAPPLRPVEFSRRMGNEGGGLYQTTSFPFPYPLPWSENPSGDIHGGGGERNI